MDQVRFMKTSRNGNLLISPSGFCYIRNRISKDQTSEFWRCEFRDKCPGRAITKHKRKNLMETNSHTHLPDPVRIEARQIRNDMKVAVQNPVGLTNIIQTGLLNASEASKSALPSVKHLKRNLQRQRNIIKASTATSSGRDTIQLLLEYQTTGNLIDPENFLLWDSGSATGAEERIIIFGSQKNLDFLATCTAIFMDGTFKNAPSDFVQFYTIHGTRPLPPDNKPCKAVPLIFLLLPDKTESTYLRVFNKISSLLPQWAPMCAMLDFEKGPINALKLQWPDVAISGSFFHLNQNIWEEIKNLGLSEFYGQDIENSVHLKMLAALAFVPPTDVIDSWNALIILYRNWMHSLDQPLKDKLDELLIYFETNYIGVTQAGVLREPKIASINLWNVYHRTLEYYGRTDSEVEGFHSKIARTVGFQQQCIWRFLKCLQGLQAETEKLISEINSNVIIQKQQPKYVRLAERVHNILSSWPTRQSLEIYLRSLCYLFNYEGRR